MGKQIVSDSQIRLAIAQWLKESEGREFRSTLYSKLREMGYANPSVKAHEIIAGLHLMDIVNIQKRGKVVLKTINPQVDYEVLQTIIAIHKKDQDDVWMDLMSRQSCKDGRITNSRPGATGKFLLNIDGKSIYCDVFQYIDGVLEYKRGKGSIKRIKCSTIKIFGI